MRKPKLIHVFRIFCAYRHSFKSIENNKSSLRTFGKNWNPLVPSDAFLLSVRFVCVKEPTSPRRCLQRNRKRAKVVACSFEREKREREREKNRRALRRELSLCVQLVRNVYNLATKGRLPLREEFLWRFPSAETERKAPWTFRISSSMNFEYLDFINCKIPWILYASFASSEQLCWNNYFQWYKELTVFRLTVRSVWGLVLDVSQTL